MHDPTVNDTLTLTQDRNPSLHNVFSCLNRHQGFSEVTLVAHKDIINLNRHQISTNTAITKSAYISGLNSYQTVRAWGIHMVWQSRLLIWLGLT